MAPCLSLSDFQKKKLRSGYLTSDQADEIVRKLSLEEMQGEVRKFLVGTTAKDISLMMSFAPSAKNETTDELPTHHVAPTIHQKAVSYRVGVADLDPKSIPKVPQYYHQDQLIVGHYISCGRCDVYD